MKKTEPHQIATYGHDLFTRIRHYGLTLFVVAMGSFTMMSTGTAGTPFTTSDEAMMARLVQEVPFGEKLDRFFAETSGKKLVFFNMEDDEATKLKAETELADRTCSDSSETVPKYPLEVVRTASVET